MHVLTKIFIVLVSLLAVMLVPLVVVYAYNDNSYHARYQGAVDRETAYRTQLESAEATFGASETRLRSQLQTQEDSARDLQRELDRAQVEVRSLESDLTQERARDADIGTKLSTLAVTVESSQQLTESLIDELRGLRQDALRAEREKVELDEALRDALANLDVAVAARRSLHEELQRMRDEHARALDRIGQYVARWGEIRDDDVRTGVVADKNLDATIIRVTLNQEQKLAEIDAGSRDGVKIGWKGTIHRGGSFLGNLRIIDVDINRATGIVELEDEASRGRVDVAAQVIFRAGR